MDLKKEILTVCVLLTAMCGSVFAESQQPSLNDCLALCNMNQQMIPMDNPYPGLNIPQGSMSYYWQTITPALINLGFSRSCGEGGCSFLAKKPVDCSEAVKKLGRCNYPHNNGVLKSPININWVYQ